MRAGGWWLQHERIIFPETVWNFISSQVTFTHIVQRGRLKPPSRLMENGPLMDNVRNLHRIWMVYEWKPTVWDGACRDFPWSEMVSVSLVNFRLENRVRESWQENVLLLRGVFTQIQVYIYIYTYIRKYIYIYIYTYIHMYIYIVW